MFFILYYLLTLFSVLFAFPSLTVPIRAFMVDVPTVYVVKMLTAVDSANILPPQFFRFWNAPHRV